LNLSDSADAGFLRSSAYGARQPYPDNGAIADLAHAQGALVDMSIPSITPSAE
jgi:hypothetical protein